LDVPILDIKKYIVLYRKDKIGQLESYYRFTTEKHWKIPYNIDKLRLFCKDKSDYYDNFIKKWVQNVESTILPIDFETIVSNPDQSYKSIMSFLYPDLVLKDESFSRISSMKFCEKEIKIHHIMSEDVHMQLENELKK
jgi:hypothetical protein